MATQTTQLHATRNDLGEDVRSATVELLNQQLADTFDLYSQTKQAHWNVKGHHFYSLHLLFDKLAEVLEPFVDEIAERVTALGGTARGTARMAASSSRLKEYPGNIFEGLDHIKALSDRWAAYAANTRAAIDQADERGDQATADLLTEIAREVDKGLWFIEAHVQK